VYVYIYVYVYTISHLCRATTCYSNMNVIYQVRILMITHVSYSGYSV
jgi:hypothetical protein